MTILAKNLTNAGPCDYVVDRRSLVVGQDDGRVWEIPLTPRVGLRRRRELTRVTSAVVGLATVTNLDRVAVLTDDGHLWLTRPLAKRAGTAKDVGSVASQPVAIVSDGSEVIVLDRAGGNDVLIAVDPGTGSELARFDVSGLAGVPIAALVSDGPRRVATILEDGRWGGFDIDAQTMTTNPVAAAVGALAWVDQAAGWAVTVLPDGRLGALRADVANPLVSGPTPSSPIVAAAVSETGELLTVEADRVEITPAAGRVHDARHGVARRRRPLPGGVHDAAPEPGGHRLRLRGRRVRGRRSGDGRRLAVDRRHVHSGCASRPPVRRRADR